MTAHLLIMYPHPKDVKEFDRAYREEQKHEIASEKNDEDDHEDRERDRVEDIDRAHHHAIDASAEEARDGAVRDADDSLVLAEAIEAGVDVVVTGDNDVLSVAGQAPFPIVTPRGFWNLLRSERRD